MITETTQSLTSSQTEHLDFISQSISTLRQRSIFSSFSSVMKWSHLSLSSPMLMHGIILWITHLMLSLMVPGKNAPMMKCKLSLQSWFTLVSFGCKTWRSIGVTKASTMVCGHEAFFQDEDLWPFEHFFSALLLMVIPKIAFEKCGSFTIMCATKVVSTGNRIGKSALTNAWYGSKVGM